MNRDDEVYKIGLAMHGHKCPAMPLGLRAAEAAMQTLGVQRIWSPRLNQVVTWIIAPLLVLIGIRFVMMGLA